MKVIGRQIVVRGRVQGVGFRPFVWQLATNAGLTGQVLNDGNGVLITAWGQKAALDSFLGALGQNLPPLAEIANIAWTSLEEAPSNDGFHIVSSNRSAITTEITPDAATCPECLLEIFDPKNRRYRYPFTNCTHCGPRLSIVQDLPYDRARTSMASFEMCVDCRREYEDPADRRFHAQPNACPVCGPKIWLENCHSEIDVEDPILEIANRIGQGAIVAIKGIGGFHLACDATNADAVAELRQRKRRAAKPLAIMAKDIDQIRTYCHVSDDEAKLLTSPTAPIVLLRSTDTSNLSGIAPRLRHIGVMLPHSPLHHLLLAAVGRPLVMTSGNLSATPQITNNAQARTALKGIADDWLLHDRDIVNRLDDSVVRIDQGSTNILRRARGLAPSPINLHDAFAQAPPTLAMGGELKSTFCLVNNGQAVPSQHIGDLKNAETYASLIENISLFRELYRFDPAIIAVDLHPDYMPTRLGRRLAEETSAKLVRVQHHHAHLVSCLAEHQISPHDPPSVGIILDGTGLGLDGTVWGGEVLLGDYGQFERKAHFQPIALPGGDQAILEPWRSLIAHLAAAFGPDWQAQIAGTDLSLILADKPVAFITQMIEKQLNTPDASSAGRLFDAVAAALGIAFDRQQYEGQAAIELEAAAIDCDVVSDGYPVAISRSGVLSWMPLWTALLSDLRSGVDRNIIAAKFHVGLADALVEIARRVATDADSARIVLSGGVMQNQILLCELCTKLTDMGFDVLRHRSISANDSGLSLGQASVAALK